MRVWHLLYYYLDSRRLQSQHFESHCLLTIVLEGRRWGSISDQFKNSLSYVVDSHDRARKEMDFRKKEKGNQVTEHSTPPPELSNYASQFDCEEFYVTEELLLKDVRQLRAKWEREGYYFGMGRMDLRFIERDLGIFLGRSVESAERMRERTKKLIKANKFFLEANNQKKLRMQDKVDLIVKTLGRDPLGRYV